MRAACTLMRSLEPSAAILARTSIRYRRRGAPSPSRCEARWWAWEPVRRLVQLAAFSAVLRRVCGLLGLLRWAWSWSIASARLISSFCSKENPRVKPCCGRAPLGCHTFDPPTPLSHGTGCARRDRHAFERARRPIASAGVSSRMMHSAALLSGGPPLPDGADWSFRREILIDAYDSGCLVE